MMLLTDEEIDKEHNRWCMRRGKENLKISWRQWIAKAQVKKIALKLKEIYGIPDLKMEHDRMGEFIKELMGDMEL